jgi:O-antigen ligase
MRHSRTTPPEAVLVSTPEAGAAAVSPGHSFWRAALLLLLVIPWINPFANGPSPAAMSWLVAAACAVLLWTLPGRIDPDLMAGSLLAAALLSSSMALAQFFGWSDALSPWVNSPGVGHAFGNLRQRNQLASLLSIGLTALLYFDNARPLRWPGWLMIGLLAIGMACSASRTGLVQWLLVWLLVLFWTRRSARRPLGLAVAAVLGYGLAVFALPILLQAWTGVDSVRVFDRIAAETVDCSSRITLWSNVLHLIAQRPLWGWGLGELDYAHYVTLYPGERFCDILDNAHNLPLQMAVEWGLPAALLVCTLLLWAVVRGRPWAQQRPDCQMAWTVLALLAVHSLLEYPLWYGPFQIVAIWCAWHLWRRADADTPACEVSVAGIDGQGASATGTDASRAPMPGVRSRHGALRLACGLTGLLMCAYASWDYRRISQMYMPPEQRTAFYRVDTLNKVKDSLLFRSQVQFAELATTPLTRANAERLHQLALDLLHFSPEARVIERLIESATLLGRKDEAMFHLARYRRAFPAEHEQWSRRLMLRAQRRPASAPQAASAALSTSSGR